MANYSNVVFKQYTGTKTVKAAPMSRKEAEEVLGRKMYADKDKRALNEHGYLVEYPDGYQSWSPKDVFEKSYMVSETHIDRMIIEREEVMQRFLKGRQFSFSDYFARLSDQQRTLLRKQLDCMENYLYVLAERIALERHIEEGIMKSLKEQNGTDGSRVIPLPNTAEGIAEMESKQN